MTSTTIAGTCYLLGGESVAVLYAPVSSLIQKATSPLQQSANQDGSNSVWETLPDTPLKCSAAASLSGNLLAVGGCDDQNHDSPAIHVFLPHTNTWTRLVPGDLPAAVSLTSAVTLSDNRVPVCGGYDMEASKKSKLSKLCTWEASLSLSNGQYVCFVDEHFL